MALGALKPAGNRRHRLAPQLLDALEDKPDAQRVSGNNGNAPVAKLPPPGARTVALEVTGRRITTPKLADELGRLRDLGQDLSIIVGGPDGLCPTLSGSCDMQWSLSDLTLPHPMVRILLAEQVYRAWSILAGHPYHRG